MSRLLVALVVVSVVGCGGDAPPAPKKVATPVSVKETPKKAIVAIPTPKDGPKPVSSGKVYQLVCARCNRDACSRNARG